MIFTLLIGGNSIIEIAIHPQTIVPPCARHELPNTAADHSCPAKYTYPTKLRARTKDN